MKIGINDSGCNGILQDLPGFLKLRLPIFGQAHKKRRIRRAGGELRRRSEIDRRPLFCLGIARSSLASRALPRFGGERQQPYPLPALPCLALLYPRTAL